MMGSRGVHPWRVIVSSTLVTAGIIASSTIVVPGVAAAPSRDIREVQAQVRDLEMQAAAATERYKQAQVRLDGTHERQAGLQSKVLRERDALTELTASASDLARGAYMSGGVETSLQVLLADNPSDFLAQAAVLDSVAQSQAAAIRLTGTVQLRLAQSEAELADQEELAATNRDDMDAAQAEVEARLADAQAVLDSLQAAERERLDALEAQQRQESQIAAQQAIQTLAASPSGSDASPDGGPVIDSGAGGSRAQAAVAYALSRVGAPYSYSAHPPTSWDCSKLTAAAWAQSGVGLTPLSYSQWDQVRHIPDSELQPGDLVFYFGGNAHHVALYIGNGKMVSASNPSDGVEVIDYKGPWYAEHYSGAGRVVG